MSKICGRTAPIERASPSANKPILLSSDRYDKLLTNAYKNESVLRQEEKDEENKYLEYLREGHNALFLHFGSNVARTQDEKLQEIKKQIEQKNEKIKVNYHQTKDVDEQYRREKIQKARDVLTKFKPGMRELQSAAIYCEVLHAREKQDKIKKEYQRVVQEQESAALQACKDNFSIFLKEDIQRAKDQAQRGNQYKKELLQIIEDNTTRKAEERRETIKQQREELERNNKELKEEIERERARLEQRKQMQRQHALEAKRMADQRRLREKMEEEINGRICCVYNAGKKSLDEKKEAAMQRALEDKRKRLNMNASYTHNLQKTKQQTEEERIKRDMYDMNQKFLLDEEEHQRNDAALKKVRITEQRVEQQRLQEEKLRQEEIHRFDIAVRLKNAEINARFQLEEAETRKKAQEHVRNKLAQQIQDKAAAVVNAVPDYVTSYDADDSHYFEYAYNLMADAKKKGRPLYPFLKPIEDYKRYSKIPCSEHEQPHLPTDSTIGRGEPIKSTARPLASKDKKPTPNAASSDTAQTTQTHRQHAVENCLKITQLTAAEIKSQKDRKNDKCPITQRRNDSCNKIKYNLSDLKALYPHQFEEGDISKPALKI